MPRQAPIVVLDTSVMLSAGLTELLVTLQSRGAVRLQWSTDIWDEFAAKVDVRPTKARERIRAALEQVPDAQVDVEDGDGATAAGGVRDENDVHVLAAGLAAGRLATDDDFDGRVVLLTRNLKDFDIGQAAARQLEILDPDPFIAGLIEGSPEVFAFVDHNPTERFDHYIEVIRRDQMTLTADALVELHSVIAELDGGAGGGPLG